MLSRPYRLPAAVIRKGPVRDRLFDDPRLQRAVENVTRCGPRPVGELIAELLERGNVDPSILDRLEAWTRLDPRTVAAVGGRDFPRFRPRLVPDKR